MLRIGLTGGIGSGKSRVCALFEHLGAPVIDTDTIARDLVRPGSRPLRQIAALFGDEVIQEDGNLDRSQVRRLVFSSPNKLQQLEALLHPLIREEMQRQIEALNYPYVILAIPLLLEKGWQQQLDRIVVVDCSVHQQLQRASQRDNSNVENIKRIIDSQISREARLAAADDIIDNSGTHEMLQPQVEALHRRYLQLAENN